MFPSLPVISKYCPLYLSDAPIALLSRSDIISLTDTDVYSIGVGVSTSFADSVFADVPEEDVVLESEFPPTAPITPTATTAKTTHLSFPLFFLAHRMAPPNSFIRHASHFLCGLCILYR